MISNTHLRARHQTDTKRYIKRFGRRGVGFIRSIWQLPKNDARYIAWRRSLLRRPPPWSKGYTKDTHPSVAKISATFTRKRIDNFAAWRKEARKIGLMRAQWPALKKDVDLAELLGVVFGDGHIEKFPRTESLTISANASNKGFIRRYADLVEKLFEQKPYVKKVKTSNCIRIRIYQKEISSRLEIPSGDRGSCDIKIPEWILENTTCLIAYLRGLYEAEGSFRVHKPTSTYKLLFATETTPCLITSSWVSRNSGFIRIGAGIKFRYQEKLKCMHARR
ncbi:MAG: hypothetical protein HY006_00845 [Candidatus Sungbacteria bacterium]|nr:hypothetical protein [Candidatus Sungbacteria bacterium]